LPSIQRVKLSFHVTGASRRAAPTVGAAAVKTAGEGHQAATGPQAGTVHEGVQRGHVLDTRQGETHS